MFKKLKQKLAEETDGEQSPLKQNARQVMIQSFDRLHASFPLV